MDFNVAVSVENQSHLQEFYSRNLSSGGIFLEVPGNPPPIGAKVKLRFTISPIERSFSVQAQVIHHHHYKSMNEKLSKTEAHHGIGLEFLDLSAQDQELIESYITGRALHVSS